MEDCCKKTAEQVFKEVKEILEFGLSHASPFIRARYGGWLPWGKKVIWVQKDASEVFKAVEEMEKKWK